MYKTKQNKIYNMHGFLRGLRAPPPTVCPPAAGPGLTLARHLAALAAAAGPVHEKGASVRAPIRDGVSNTPSSNDLMPERSAHGALEK
jgi:hypothetical protein